MFKLYPMRRAERAESDVNKVKAAFSESRVLTLALCDEPFPYSVIVNYAPLERADDLYLIFHGARAGRKYELIKRNNAAAFSILLRSSERIKDSCSSTNCFKSICGEGRIELLEGDEALQALCVLMAHHGSQAEPALLMEKMRPLFLKTQTYALKVERAALKENPLKA